jgi:hypothetical protein
MNGRDDAVRFQIDPRLTGSNPASPSDVAPSKPDPSFRIGAMSYPGAVSPSPVSSSPSPKQQTPIKDEELLLNIATPKRVKQPDGPAVKQYDEFIGFRVPADMLDAIDAMAGSRTKSEFIRELLQSAIDAKQRRE